MFAGAYAAKTIGRLKHLSGTWHISQAEVVRRAIALAEEKVQAETDATALLRSIHNSGRQLAREQAEDYLAEINESRRYWRQTTPPISPASPLSACA